MCPTGAVVPGTLYLNDSDVIQRYPKIHQWKLKIISKKRGPRESHGYYATRQNCMKRLGPLLEASAQRMHERRLFITSANENLRGEVRRACERGRL